jgi:glutamyl-tRNA synthetase
MQETDDFTAEQLSEKIKNWVTSQEMGFGKVMMPLRLALVGAMQGPDVFAIAAILGRDETVKRLETAIQAIS